MGYRRGANGGVVQRCFGLRRIWRMSILIILRYRGEDMDGGMGLVSVGWKSWPFERSSRSSDSRGIPGMLGRHCF
jgi:hypothetical protein